MVNLQLKKSRTIHSIENYSALYKYDNNKERLAYSAGVLNSIWNLWNNFWRDFWITQVQGGIDTHRHLIPSIHNKYTSFQSCHFLLHKLGKRRIHNIGDTISGSFQEATWGDPKVIETLAFEFRLNYILLLRNQYRTKIEHFQIIRNCFIHLNNFNVSSLNSITSYYIFSANQKTIDILEAKSTRSHYSCFDEITGNLKGMLIEL